MIRTALFTCALLLTISCGVSRAALVTTVLTLDPATPTENTLGLTLIGVDMNNNPVVIGNSSTEISGTIIADIEIDRATGVISSINLNGGDMVGSTWVMPVPALMTTLTGTGTTATADTDPDTTPVTGTSFPAAPHRLVLTGGVVNPGDTQLAGTIIEGSGNGTLTSTKNGDNWDIAFSMNLDDTEPLSGANLNIQGTVFASGSITAVPEPSSVLAMVAIGGCLAVRRRRR